MAKYIPPSQRRSHTTISSNSHLRRFKNSTLAGLNNQIKRNMKYNQYLNNKLFGSNNSVHTPPHMNTIHNNNSKYDILTTSSKQNSNGNAFHNKDESFLPHSNVKKLIEKSKNKLDEQYITYGTYDRSKGSPANSYIDPPNKVISPPETLPNNNVDFNDIDENKTYVALSTSKAINGKVFANAKHLNYALKNPIETSPQLSHPTITNDINGAATSKAISSKNDATKVHVTISISTASKTLPRGHNEIDDTDQNISHQIDEKIDIKYATLTPKDYAFLRAFTHVINAPISTPMTIIHTATHGTLLLHSDGIKLDEKSDKETSTFNQSLSNIKQTLTPNNYILNGKNENILASTLILLIISAVLIQYTNGITIKKVNL